MLTDVPYEITDERDGADALGPVAFLNTSGSSVRLAMPNHRSWTWEIPEDDEAYMERDEGRTVILFTDEGRITLTRLTIAQHEEMAAVLGVPDMPTQADVDAYWTQTLG
jgi:hypothetical protein